MASFANGKSKKMFWMRVMGQDGDSGLRWDPSDPVSSEKAREFFAAHAGSVYLAFQDDHGVGRQIPAGGFDPTVHDDVVLMPVPVIG